MTSLQIEELKVRGTLQLEESRQLATESLEQKKFETALILEAIKTPSRTDAIRNLKFFVAAGFIEDPDGKISSLNDERLPSISIPSQESISRSVRATGMLVAEIDDGNTVYCTGVALSPKHVVSAPYCGDMTQSSKEDGRLLFVNGLMQVPIQRIEVTEGLALFEVASPDQLENFLNPSDVREPVLGERIYFAMGNPSTPHSELRVCEVVHNAPSESDFGHSCLTDSGAAGAVVIAVADDALLGIHYKRSTRNGIAAKLPPTIAARIAELATSISSRNAEGLD